MIVEERIKLLQKHFYSKCKHSSKKPCDVCDKEAEIWAYIQDVVPSVYQNLTIDAFVGMANNEIVLDDISVATAKDAIIKYCWKDIEEGQSYSPNWTQTSLMNKRRIQGVSLIIYGNPYRVIQNPDSTNNSIKSKRVAIGRTLLAAVVIKEAIMLRQFTGHLSDSYKWVQYNTLCNALLSQAKGDKADDDLIFDCGDADWLVVDGITFETLNESVRSFRANVLDKFFSRRLTDGLPSILTFQNDVSKLSEDALEGLGTSMNSIVHNKQTHFVAL